jgi:hypothetical protein
MLLASRDAGAQTYPSPREHGLELGVHSGLAVANPGVVREGASGRAAALAGIDVRYDFWPFLAVGAVVQTTFASTAQDTPVQDAFANFWFRMPRSVFRPWVTLGVGVLRSALDASFAWDLGFGIDWCVVHARERTACTLAFTTPGILLPTPTRDTQLAMENVFFRVAFQP